MVFSPDDAKLPNLGSISTNLGKLSTDDVNGLGFSTNDRVDSSSGQQKIEPINEEKPMLKSQIERTTTGDVIQIGTSQVKLGKEFDGPVVIDGQVDMIMKDVVLDHETEKTGNVVDSKYLQPRWCPPGLTRTQKRKLQRI
jgi:hypothetical protein